MTYDVIGDKDTIDAFFTLSRLEGIIPAIESAHAVAYAMQLAQADEAWLHPYQPVRTWGQGYGLRH